MKAVAGNLRSLSLSTAVFLAVASVSWAGPASAGNLIVNGDFSADANLFGTFPGNTGVGENPASITGWTHNGMMGVGVNGIDSKGRFTALGPSAQQASPDRNWAFLQGIGAALYQIITVTPGVTYTVSYVAANRDGNPDAALSADVYDGTYGGTNRGILPGGIPSKAYSMANFETESFTFTATLDTATLVFKNQSGGADNTVNVTDVSVVPAPSN